ncbi:MAG: tRNA lysidine(34) synthetase TilS, partial [Candidatus Raymondbacteria bacterium RifOxyC12_full_50_8]
MACSFLQRILRYVEKHAMLKQGDRVLLAVSGGADSVAMAFLFTFYLKKRFSLELGIAHLNHAMRGAHSDRDQDFVKSLAEKLGLSLYSATHPVKKIRGRSIEEIAREVRYAFLNATARKYRFSRIATAHHCNDQAETVLMRLCSGCGTTGLAGIRPVNGMTIRPLLPVLKSELLAFLRAHGHRFRHDESNDDCALMRNKIRHTVLPYLEKTLGPSLCRRISRTAESIFSDFANPPQFFALLVRLLRRPYTLPGMAFTRSDLAQLPPSVLKGVIEEALRTFEGPTLSAAHLESIQGLVAKGKPSSSLHLPGTFRARCVYDSIVLEKTRPTAKKSSGITVKKMPGAYRDKVLGHAIIITIGKHTKGIQFPASGEMTAMFDYDSLPKTMSLR